MKDLFGIIFLILLWIYFLYKWLPIMLLFLFCITVPIVSSRLAVMMLFNGMFFTACSTAIIAASVVLFMIYYAESKDWGYYRWKTIRENIETKFKNLMEKLLKRNGNHNIKRRF